MYPIKQKMISFQCHFNTTLLGATIMLCLGCQDIGWRVKYSNLNTTQIIIQVTGWCVWNINTDTTRQPVYLYRVTPQTLT